MTNKKIQTTIGKNENNNAKINLISKCISCSHKEVCKYKEEFEKFMEEIKNKGIKIPKMFNLDITCSKYSSCYGIRTIDTTPQIPPLPQIVPLSTPGVVPAPQTITTPDLIPTLNPKVICEVNDGSINTINSTTCGISGNKGTISLQG